ncbi:MAG: PorT family protein [Treponema sp.]|nr:PorT family protein [Treponema sp.]
MKKRISFALIFFAAASLFAVDLDLTIGLRAGMDINFFDFDCGDWSGDSKIASGFGGNAFVQISVPGVENLAIQPELGIRYHNIKIDRSYVDRDFNFTTLDIPVMVTYAFHLNELFFLQPEVGPRFSFVLGKISGDDDYTVKYPFNFGFEAGLTFGVKTGPGHILVNTRFVRDFTKITVDDTLKHTANGDTIGSVQSVNISLGYQMQLF